MCNWLLFPVKLIFRSKVKRYEAELLELRNDWSILGVKFRRSGCVDKVNAMFYSSLYQISKRERFVSKWKIQ